MSPLWHRWVVNLPCALKSAAGRYQDFADVVSLIRANGPDESFMQSLHPSLRLDFSECLDEMRREDQYEARMDRDADGAG